MIVGIVVGVLAAAAIVGFVIYKYKVAASNLVPTNSGE